MPGSSQGLLPPKYVPGADAVIRVVYGSRLVDYILKFEDDGTLGDVRAALERKFLLAGFVLEHDSAFNQKETYVKIFSSFDILASEAERKCLKFSLKMAEEMINGPHHKKTTEEAKGDVEAPPIIETPKPMLVHVERDFRKGGGTFHNVITDKIAKKLNEDHGKPTSVAQVWSRLRKYVFAETVDPIASTRFQLSQLGDLRGGDFLFPCDGDEPFPKVANMFFSRAHRILLTYYILSRIVIAPVELQEIANPHMHTHRSVGVTGMLKIGGYTKFYSLHDGSDDVHTDPPNMRSWLKKNWSLRFFSLQPLDLIRDYFGEKIGLYFAFLGFYTTWLYPAAFVGILAFCYGVFYSISQDEGDTTFEQATSLLFDNASTLPYSAFVCVWATLFIEFWKRRNAYLAWYWDVMNYEETEVPRPEWYGTKVRLSLVTKKKEYYYPEHVRQAKMVASCVCIALAILVVLVSVMGTVTYTAFASNYFGECVYLLTENQTCRYKEPISGNSTVVPCSDPCYAVGTPDACAAFTFPFGDETFSACAWENTTGVCYPNCLAYTGGVTCMTEPVILSYNRTSCQWQDKYYIGDITSSTLSLIVIVSLNLVFEYVALLLNNWENHKTPTQWEDALITKTFFFQFLNSYTTLFYIAFFKGTVANSIFGNPYLHDSCSYGSCFNELMIQLAIVFLGKQLIGQVFEVGLPYLMMASKNKARNIQVEAIKKKHREILVLRNGAGQAQDDKFLEGIEEEIRHPPQWIMDDSLEDNETVLFDDYNEMALQFGFITLFVAAFPLAPLFALLNNLVEIRSDSYKILTSFQRPPCLQARDMGTWQDILNILGIIAVITNSFVVAFSSLYIDNALKGVAENRDWNQVVAGKLALVIVFEHVVIFLKVLIAYLIPDIPGPVKLAIDRESYLARLKLEGISEDQEADGDAEDDDFFKNMLDDVKEMGSRARTRFRGHLKNT